MHLFTMGKTSTFPMFLLSWWSWLFLRLFFMAWTSWVLRPGGCSNSAGKLLWYHVLNPEWSLICVFCPWRLRSPALRVTVASDWFSLVHPFLPVLLSLALFMFDVFICSWSRNGDVPLLVSFFCFVAMDMFVHVLSFYITGLWFCRTIFSYF